METVLFPMPSDVEMVFCFRYTCLTFHNRILICFFQPDPDLKKKTGFRFLFFDCDHDRDSKPDPDQSGSGFHSLMGTSSGNQNRFSCKKAPAQSEQSVSEPECGKFFHNPLMSRMYSHLLFIKAKTIPKMSIAAKIPVFWSGYLM